MYSKTQPKIAHTIQGGAEVVTNTSVELLDDGRLLVCNSGPNKTGLLLYKLQGKDIDTWSDEKCFPRSYSYLSGFNNQLFLLIPATPGEEIVFMYKTIFSKSTRFKLKREKDTYYTVVDKQLAALSCEVDAYEQKLWSIRLYDDNFLAQEPIYLFDIIPLDAKVKSIKQLNNGLIAINCDHDLILLEKINDPHCPFIKKASIPTNGVRTLDLWNGDILIYDDCGINAKVWSCNGIRQIAPLGYKSTNKDEKLNMINSILFITPMSDGIHLIVKNGFETKLYNMKTGLKKGIDLGIYHGFAYHILPQGQVLIETKKGYFNTEYLLVDFEEITSYRKTFPKNAVLNYGLFSQYSKQTNFPNDIKQVIATLLIHTLLKEQPAILKLVQEYPALNGQEPKKAESCVLF